jgi:hypothetical protein
MFVPKPISAESVPAALSKAERYRLLNEPGEAESICLDILAIAPENQAARVSLILALTDQIPGNPKAFAEALAQVSHLTSAYQRAYYEGIAWERRAKARLHTGGQGAREYVHEWILRALDLFAEAERQRVHGNDDALLRWNACVRFLQAHPELERRSEPAAEPILLE